MSVEEAFTKQARDEADAARFVYWFSMPARAGRSLEQWRFAIDKAMEADAGPEDTRLVRQLRASIELFKMKDRARRK